MSKHEGDAVYARKAEKQRVRAARLTAEHRCHWCRVVRDKDDTQTHRCPSCRARMNRDNVAKYAKRRALNPPDFSRAPERPFRYGKTRLENPRHISIVLDEETYFWIKACRQHYCRSEAYEPYQVSEVMRRLLGLLAHAPADIPDASMGRTPTGRMRHGDACGLRLCFPCDAPNFARMTAHHQSVGGTFAQAVRDCICHAAQYAFTLPGEEAKRLLWPGYAELPPRAIEEP